MQFQRSKNSEITNRAHGSAPPNYAPNLPSTRVLVQHLHTLKDLGNIEEWD